MKYFIRADGQVFAYESDGSQDHDMEPNLRPMTSAEVATHLNPDPTIQIRPVVTRFQARAALMLTPSANAFDNMLAEVDAVMTHQDTDPMARLAWTEAQEFYRQSPTVLGMAAILGLSAEELDQLFILAATMQA